MRHRHILIGVEQTTKDYILNTNKNIIQKEDSLSSCGELEQSRDDDSEEEDCQYWEDKNSEEYDSDVEEKQQSNNNGIPRMNKAPCNIRVIDALFQIKSIRRNYGRSLPLVYRVDDELI